MVRRLWALTFLIVQLIGLLLLSAPAFADRTVGQKDGPKYWTIATEVQRTSSLYLTGEDTDSSSWDMTFAPRVMFNRDYSLGFYAEASQDEINHTFDFGKTQLNLKKDSGYWMIGKRVKLTPRLITAFPMGKAARDSSLEVGTGVGGKFNVNSDYFIWKQLDVSLDLTLFRNFHRYDTDESGKVNAKYASSQLFTVAWNFDRHWSIAETLGHYDTVSYQGTYQDYLSHTETIGYAVNSRWAVAAGHQWGSPYVASRKSNGQDINFQVQDEENSLVFIGVSFVL